MPDLATALKNAINRIDTNKEKQMQNQNQVRQTTPSDISNIVNEWAEDKAADAGQHKAKLGTSAATTNTSRATFNLVKANPGSTYMQIVELAGNEGHKRESAGSILTQMYRVGMIRRDAQGLHYVNQPDYTPVNYKLLREKQLAEGYRRRSKEEIKADNRREARIARIAKAAAKEVAKEAIKIPATRKETAGIAALGTQAGGVIEVKQTPAAAPLTQTVANFDADQLLSTLSFNQAIALYKKLKTMLGEV